jgi:hypothetical protein
LDERGEGVVDRGLISGPGVQEETEDSFRAIGREGVSVETEGDDRAVKVRMKVLRFCNVVGSARMVRNRERLTGGRKLTK